MTGGGAGSRGRTPTIPEADEPFESFKEDLLTGSDSHRQTTSTLKRDVQEHAEIERITEKSATIVHQERTSESHSFMIENVALLWLYSFILFD